MFLLLLDLSLLNLQNFKFLLSLRQLLMKLLRQVLLLLGLVPHSINLRLHLHDLVFFLLDELFDGLESFITLLHAKQWLLPVFEQSFFGHDDALNLNGSLFQGVTGGSRLFFLGDQLGLVEGFLLVKTLDLFVHRVDEQILLFLDLFEVANVFFGAVGCSSGQRKLRLHDLVVLFDLL